MNDYVIVSVATAAVVAGLYAVVRWRFGNGLLARIFGMNMPTIGITGYLGFLLGDRGVSVMTLTPTIIVGGVIVFGMIVLIQRGVVVKMQAQASSVMEVISGLSSTSSQAAATAEEQASAVAQVSSTIEEISRMSQTTADTSQKVVKAAGDAVAQGDRGIQSVGELVDIMKRFGQVTDFIEIVNQVAEQSNLLAVNAGIEAAKAGEHGRGFAVVASEVRNLAEQSKDAAKQIREIIAATDAGHRSAESTNKVISELAAVLRESSDMARQISGAAVQQAAGVKQLLDATGNLTTGGEQTAQASQEIKRAAENLSAVILHLNELIHGASAAA
jgi:methyl-accepting chemotaxis protein